MSLKAAALRALERNRVRNISATDPATPRNSRATFFLERVALVAGHIGADPEDLVDWYREDQGDFCTLDIADLLAVASDYWSRRAWYRGQIASKADFPDGRS